ncbi:putative MFS family arabinose efflux permease [Stackebrandtia endophytica]|uniref:Putative MFS family arabinose efflux permease n=1 Tax=Stackebrandtia endophytica TaxID=1496996 RepID=A0A543AV69_9ACTN|nr:MFS transporter [Stackebrandtia endophytica]TQL76476.1 putative MFS family arabinose efflux permease [Stackebrandtia endophytica]
MLAVLRNTTYRRLFTAQVVALSGTGLATVALGLLAYDLSGGNASAVLGTALAIKMIAYVVIAPVVTAMTDRIPPRTLLITMDATRALIASALPFVTQVWQVYVLIFLLQAASATFTPTFQATIPRVLSNEADYTRALSLSRLAYDLESLVSPILAASLLTLVSYGWLFTGTGVGFLASGLLVASVVLPRPGTAQRSGGRWTNIGFGTRLYLATPRLRALSALNMAVAAAGAVVIVNTVVLVRDHLHRDVTSVAVALAAYGAGSMTVAVLLPRVLDRLRDRRLMPPAAMVLALALAVLTATLHFDALTWPFLLTIWAILGAATAVVLTPVGRLVHRSARSPDLPAAFAAQFSLSHACWLVTYPLTGWLATTSMTAAAATATLITAVTATAAAMLWPTSDPATLPHVHTDLPPGHPHLADAAPTGHGYRHTHHYVIDRLHSRWPLSATGRVNG